MGDGADILLCLRERTIGSACVVAWNHGRCEPCHLPSHVTFYFIPHFVNVNVNNVPSLPFVPIAIRRLGMVNCVVLGALLQAVLYFSLTISIFSRTYMFLGGNGLLWCDRPP